MAEEEAARELADRTRYLYRSGLPCFLRDAAALLGANPARFLRTLLCAVQDALRLGALNRTAMGVIYRFLAAATVARILVDQGCSHIHAHFAHVPTDIAMYASLLTGIPFSFTAHANDIFVHAWLLDVKVKRSAFAVAISAYNREFLTAKGAPADKIHVVHCGVDPAAFVPRTPPEPHQGIRIGSLGRMVDKKGFDVLIRACRVLKDSEVDFTLELAGDGPLREELARYARSLGLTGEVAFPGPLAHDAVPAWLKRLDAFVLPCRRDHEGDMDGIPVVLMEAMLSGVPVVSTRITGIPELIEDRVSGYLASPEDAHDLASAMREAVTGHREGIVGNAIARVKDRFDLSKNARTLAGLFRGERT
jgi:glycosyltransferase involved in cell wall biosynthesis